MPLLSLPPELIHLILTFSSWPDILSFISTTKLITSHIVSQSGLCILRRLCVDRLRSWERDRRVERSWPLHPNPPRGQPWYSVFTYHGRPCMALVWPDGDLDSAPCYTCLRIRNWRHFSAPNRCGDTAIGQKGMQRRICAPCGVKRGVYRRGNTFFEYAVCRRCESIMSPWNGARFNGEDVKEVEGSIPPAFDIFVERRFDEEGQEEWINKYPGFDNFWWWDYSQMCGVCTAEEGYTVEEFLDHKPKGDFVVRRMKQRYNAQRIASLERARQHRMKRGIPEPEGALDIEALKEMDDPFPDFKPPPSFFASVRRMTYISNWKELRKEYEKREPRVQRLEWIYSNP